MSSRRRRDAGAGGVLALAVVAVTVAVTLAVIATGGALAARQRAVAAADNAALAASDVLLGAVAGEACTVAARVAAAHQLTLSACVLDGADATVTVRAEVLGVPVEVRSRAGPPP